MRVGNTSLYSSHGTGPAPMLKKKVYSGIATNVVVRSGSKDLCVTCKSLKKKKRRYSIAHTEIQSKNKLTVAVVYAARSSQMAAMASPTNSPPSCSPPEVTGVANAQKVLLTGFPGVAKAAVENAARQTAMPL